VKNFIRILVLALLLVAGFSLAVVKGETAHPNAQAAAGSVAVKISVLLFGASEDDRHGRREVSAHCAHWRFFERREYWLVTVARSKSLDRA
jgi:hypothetical protein